MRFHWFRSNRDNDRHMKTARRRTTAAIVDWTNGLSCNSALTKGIYNNTFQGMKLAGFGFNIINVPVSFMGVPVVSVPGDEDLTDVMQQVILDRKKQVRAIHTQSHRDGTVWVYPEYRETGLSWRMIPDESVSKIVMALDEERVVRVETEEEITVEDLVYDTTNTVTKAVVYTEKTVTTTYSGSYAPDDSIVVNTAGVLPIPFANNPEVNEARGKSDYERLLADLKNYHDVDLSESTLLAKFTTKMVQTVSNWTDWLSNNGFSSDGSDIDSLDIWEIDLIVNQEGETTEFIHPSDATAGHETKLKTIFHKLVELSGIPEIAWGLKTEGNLASVEENMAILMQYCADKQEQKVDPYTQLLNASARLMAQAFEIPEGVSVKVTWDVLDATSEATKAEIFKQYSEAISNLVTVAGITPSQLHSLWRVIFPSITEEELDSFNDGLGRMISHIVSAKATPTEALNAAGLLDQ
jgi:hypothetical protein